MRIILWKGKRRDKSLHIYTRFYSKERVISIGSDCHSAYILNAVNIRKESFVFDWLYTDSRLGIQYVNENIKNNFEFFLQNLVKNERGHIISEKFPMTEFFHEQNLISSEADRSKMRKRAMRFLNTIKKENVSFLYVINPEHFSNLEDIELFISSINELNKLTGNRHKLKIFIKCHINITDSGIIDMLISSCKTITNVKIVRYFIDTKKYGLWGNSKDYFLLLKNLGIKIHRSFLPNIYID
ncbi:DUF1796 family putative cysteine peptidase [Riemerella anatipestifer]|uniref:DUF1796 family putative cysteine peptidase n=1 Tax=Riemerella anatipestifer TaxID=34085 RepID=UPI0016283B5F|nr:DUF1796 family putative cysteine peptidase [Riemerella anatipestifer]MCU7542449.1 papain-like cysteine peptidase [Riemerella anatipestifer]MCW0513067.1 papain-like cysteine peptidase [Riemerella anatipestifer]MRM96063.1 hypothetical protein [Riemerella anatipestifer]MRM99742.1 hypothetical protein [Riemerella anatipestifer]MRN01896.1 hypothetical protein [Riemerella anatipestifer]